MGKVTHGLTYSPAYRVWCSMRERCLTPTNGRYHQYGGRGIRICKRWMRFENFVADMGQPQKGLTLERKDNDKGYCPSNCIWATRSQQARNRRARVRYVTFKGKRLCLTDWSKEIGLQVSTIQMRLVAYGWSVKDALTIPRFGRPQ